MQLFSIPDIGKYRGKTNETLVKVLINRNIPKNALKTESDKTLLIIMNEIAEKHSRKNV
jgi:hypothetical protein